MPRPMRVLFHSPRIYRRSYNRPRARRAWLFFFSATGPPRWTDRAHPFRYAAAVTAHPFILTRCLLGKPGTIHGVGSPREMINLRTMSEVFARPRASRDRLLSRRPRIADGATVERSSRFYSGKAGEFIRVGDNARHQGDTYTCTVTHEYSVERDLGKKYYTAERALRYRYLSR